MLFGIGIKISSLYNFTHLLLVHFVEYRNIVYLLYEIVAYVMNYLVVLAGAFVILKKK